MIHASRVISVLDPSGLRLSVLGNVLQLQQPRSTWRKHLQQIKEAVPLSPVPDTRKTMLPLGLEPKKKVSAGERSIRIHSHSMCRPWSFLSHPSKAAF